MNYLVPIDFSDHSKNAAEYAAGLTKVWAGNVHLTHIMVPIQEEPSYLPVKTLNIKRNTVFELSAYIENLRTKFDVRSSCDMLKGDLRTEIRKTAKREKSDLIVIGMQGLTGLREHLYGSNTIAIIENSGLPVLVLPNGLAFTPYKQVVYLTTFHPRELENIKVLSVLSAAFNAAMSIVYDGNRFSESSKKRFMQQISEIQEHAVCDFRPIEGTTNVTEGLLAFSKSVNADFVSLPNHGDLVRWMGGRSLTSDFVFDLDAPVLFFPGKIH